MASWIDLPDSVAHLRYVPEMIVAMLADQKDNHIEQPRKVHALGLRSAASSKTTCCSRHSTREWCTRGRSAVVRLIVSEKTRQVGLDQLLMIRLGQALKVAPDKLRGSQGERISNQRPIAERTAQHFSEDIRRFVRSYARVVPRHAFVALLESCITVGLTTIVTAVTELLFEWAETGEIRKKSEQKPTCLFVDCANGVDRRLRALAEQSMDDSCAGRNACLSS